MNKLQRGEIDTPMLWMIILGLLFFVWIAVSMRAAKEWEQFKIDHKCKVVAKIEGQVFNTFTPTSQGLSVGVSSTPDQTGFLCDDGITYYK